jgi:hypothetical protein
MIEKKMKDTTRKNVARSPVIMIPHPFYQGSPHAGGRREDSDRHTEHDRVMLSGVSHHFVAA